MNDEKKRNLAELDAAGRQQDEHARKRDIEHGGRSQLALLRARLIRFGLLDPNDPKRATGKWRFDEETGWVRSWFEIDGFAYAEYEGAIYAEHEVHGVYEWTVLDDDGNPTEWMRDQPPWQRN